jgi:holliday junction DNA helicase RuvA
MIASLRGKIISSGINRIILEAQGVGYDVAVPLTTLDSLPRDSEVFLHVHTAMRENALELYGFATPEEKALFEMLLTVAGIGPKTSLLILSGINPDGLKKSILEGDRRRLTAIPGVGKKSAERILLELKDKIAKMPAPRTVLGGNGSSCVEDDLVSSLVNLGYNQRIAETTARKVIETGGSEVPLTQAVKLALKELMR